MEKLYPDKVYIVNMRESDTILDGLLSELSTKISLSKNLKSTAKVLIKAVATNLSYKLEDASANLKELSTLLLGENQPKPTLSKVVNEMAGKLGGITIFVDEANKPFTINGNEKKRKDNTDALSLFTMMTKELKKVGVKYVLIIFILTKFCS
jgi:hypothetical protein